MVDVRCRRLDMVSVGFEHLGKGHESDDFPIYGVCPESIFVPSISDLLLGFGFATHS